MAVLPGSSFAAAAVDGGADAVFVMLRVRGNTPCWLAPASGVPEATRNTPGWLAPRVNGVPDAALRQAIR